MDSPVGWSIPLRVLFYFTEITTTIVYCIYIMLISLSVLQPFLTCKYDPVLITYLGNGIDHYFSNLFR